MPVAAYEGWNQSEIERQVTSLKFTAVDGWCGVREPAMSCANFVVAQVQKVVYQMVTSGLSQSKHY